MTKAKTENPHETFQIFLKSYQNAAEEYQYRLRLAQMAITGTKSLIVEFEDLLNADPDLAESLAYDCHCVIYSKFAAVIFEDAKIFLYANPPSLCLFKSISHNNFIRILSGG